jgi:hypothetical protein
MAAGLGFKDFQTGEVLTAADVDGYLMQGVWVFASAAARDAAVTSPQEGNFAYLKDTNVTTYYTGSAWANLDTTGMTNPMTTTGDTIYSSSGSTPARLGIGTAGQVLQVNSGATAPEWATPASGGGMTVIGETAASALSSLTFSGFGSYKQLILIWAGVKHSGTGSLFGLRFNNNSTANAYAGSGTLNFGSADRFGATSLIDNGANVPPFGANASAAGKETHSYGYVLIDNPTSSTKSKSFQFNYIYFDNTAAASKSFQGSGAFYSTTAITTVDIVRLSGSDTFTNQNDTTIRLLGIS